MEHASLLGLEGVSAKSSTSPGQTGGWTTLSHVSCTCPFICRGCRTLRQKTPQERPALPQWPRQQSTCAIKV